MPTATSTPLPSANGIIKKFSGSGNTETEKFSVSANPWKFVWSIRPQGRSANCFVDLEGKNRKSLTIDSWNYGESFVHDRIGTFYLDIDCDGNNWEFFITSADGGLVEGG